MLINCYNVETTKNSILKYLSINMCELDSLVNSCNRHLKNEEEDFLENMIKMLSYKFSFDTEMCVYLYHFTRTLDKSCYDKGIFPIKTIFKEVLESLWILVEDESLRDKWEEATNAFLSLKYGRYTSVPRTECDNEINGFLFMEYGKEFHEQSVYYKEYGSELVVDFLDFLTLKKSFQGLKKKYYEKSYSIYVRFPLLIHEKETKLKIMSLMIYYIALKNTGEDISYLSHTYTREEFVPAHEILIVEL